MKLTVHPSLLHPCSKLEMNQSMNVKDERSKPRLRLSSSCRYLDNLSSVHTLSLNFSETIIANTFNICIRYFTSFVKDT